jgi:hypothetical protein
MLKIEDLPESKELDRVAMKRISGGSGNIPPSPLTLKSKQNSLLEMLNNRNRHDGGGLTDPSGSEFNFTEVEKDPYVHINI